VCAGEATSIFQKCSPALENDLRVFPFGNRLGCGVLGQSHCELTTIPSIRFTLGKEVLQMYILEETKKPWNGRDGDML